MTRNEMRALYQVLMGKNFQDAAGTIAMLCIFGDVSKSFVSTIEEAIMVNAGKPINVPDSDGNWKVLLDREGFEVKYPTIEEWYARPRLGSTMLKAARIALYNEVQYASAEPVKAAK